MDAVSFLVSASVFVGLYTACLHASLYRFRPSEPEHGWLALAAFGVVATSACNLMLHHSVTVEEGEFWQRWMFASSTPILVGFLRFSFCFLGVSHPWLDRAALGFSAVVVLLTLGTDRVFSGAAVVRDIPLGPHFVESRLDLLGHGVIALFVVFFFSAIVLYARALPRRDVGVQTVFATLCIWFLCGVNDAAVVTGVYEFAYLVPGGYLFIVVGVSSILVRRFASSLDEVERVAGNLHELVEVRTEELRDKELQLAHGERLAIIGTLAACVAHEVNNPLSFVISNLNRLEELWGKPEAEDEAAELVGEALEGADRVRLIVAELLDLSNQGDFRAEPTDLNYVVDSVLPFLRPAARRCARLETELHSVPSVRGDARMLGQVVLNLVLNALQAFDADTRGNRVTISTDFHEDEVRLSVSDNGPGIPPEHRERIFAPFFSRNGGGTGLGLVVTQQIVARHGGRIFLGESGEGTRMIVALPALEPAAASDRGAGTGSYRGS